MSPLSLTVLVASVMLLALASITLALMLYGWRSADDPISGPLDPSEDLDFALLVPARHEEGVLAETLGRLAALRHERFEVVAIVGEDDPGTAAVAHRMAQQHPGRVRVVIDRSLPKTKPKALNAALATCKAAVIGVFDAEDIVHPDILAVVEERMSADGAAAVQAGVHLVNFWSTWFTCRNSLEYYFWFHSRLRFQADHGFIPLGGNTVFVRRSLVELLGGWDGDCLAEDCDLGVRLSSHGLPISVVYDPAIVTREEAPVRLAEFIRQRTRWNQGYIQVIAKGEWLRLPWRSRGLALFTLSTPFLLTLTGLLLPAAALVAVLVRLPVPVVLMAYLPWVPALMTLVVEVLGLKDVARLAGRPARVWDYVRLLLSAPVYPVVLSIAAIRAVARSLRGSVGWEKTHHSGAHFSAAPARREPGRVTA